MSDSDEVVKRLPRWVVVLEGILDETKSESGGGTRARRSAVRPPDKASPRADDK